MKTSPIFFGVAILAAANASTDLTSETPGPTVVASSDPSEGTTPEHSNYDAEATIDATLSFEFYQSRPPSEEEVAGIMEATHAFFNDDLLETNSPTSSTYFVMEDIISFYQYESSNTTARFEMRFLAKFDGWCFMCQTFFNEDEFAAFTLQKMRAAKYRHYIRQYARTAAPKETSVFQFTRYVRFRGQVTSATVSVA